MTQRLWTGGTDTRAWQCRHCGYPIPDEAKTAPERDGQFCSDACLEAAADDDPSFVEGQGYKRFWTGVSVIDDLVPNGLPTNAAVACVGEPGTRRTELLTELAWRALEREEPVVIIGTNDSPMTTLERFFTLGWNPIPALESGQLRIVDCVSERLTDRRAAEEGFNEWNRFLSATATDAVETVSEPDEPQSILETVETVLADLEMLETGIVVVDSLGALESVVEPKSGQQDEQAGVQDSTTLLRDLRETICTARFVPLFVGSGLGGDPSSNTSTVPDHVFDGHIDLRLLEEPAGEIRRKQLGIRRLVGTQFTPRWVTYELRAGDGLFAFDPATETTAVYGPTRDERGGKQQPTERRGEQQPTERQGKQHSTEKE